MARLSDRQKSFADNYLKTLNAYQSAIQAGYSPKTAKIKSSQWLEKVRIKEYIQKKMKAREERTEISQDRVLKELAKIGFSDITDYLAVKEFEDTETKKITGKFVDIFLTADIDKNKTAAISELRQTKDGIALKLHNKTEALSLIGKHLGMFKDKIEHSGKVEMAQAIDLSKLSDEELGQLVEIIGKTEEKNTENN